MRKICRNSNSADKYDNPTKCWGERYEHCKKIDDNNTSNNIDNQECICSKYGKYPKYSNCAKCPKCDISFYNKIEDTINWSPVIGNFKKQNESTIYDKSMILKSDEIEVYDAPDEKTQINVKKIEGFDIASSIGKGFIKTYSDGIATSLKVFLPDKLAEEWGVIPLACCCLILVILLLCCASLGTETMMMMPQVIIVVLCIMCFSSSSASSAYPDHIYI